VELSSTATLLQLSCVVGSGRVGQRPSIPKQSEASLHFVWLEVDVSVCLVVRVSRVCVRGWRKTVFDGVVADAKVDGSGKKVGEGRLPSSRVDSEYSKDSYRDTLAVA